jgi:Leucine-rich repeat (LRR) protein
LNVVLPQACQLELLGSTLPGIDRLGLGNGSERLPFLGKLTTVRLLNLALYEEEGSHWVPRLDITNDSLTALYALATLHTLRLDGCLTVSDLTPLSHLRALSQLSLRHCSVTDLRPIASLPLTKLLLDENYELTNLSPLAAMSTLRCISLEDCKLLPDEALASITSLKELRTINLGYCLALSSTGLSTLSKLTNLKDLDFTATQLTDDVLGVLCQTLDLEELWLYGCEITNIGLSYLASQQSLRCLKLDHCERLTNLDLLPPLKALRRLGLSACGITDQCLEPLSKLVHLEELDLKGTDVSESALSTLSPLTSLTVLDLDPISDVGLQALGALTLLQTLKLHRTVSDVGLRAMARLTGIHTLDLSQCESVTHDGLRSLVSLTALHTINLSGLPIANADLAVLGQIVLLTSVDLTGCDQITAYGVWKLATLTELKALTLARCTKVNLVPNGLPPFAKLCALDLQQVRVNDLDCRLFAGPLQTLNVSSCSASLGDLSELPCEPALKILSMSRCRSFGLSCLRQLHYLPLLRELDLSYNVQVIDDHAFVLACLPLAALNVRGCTALSDTGVCALSTSRTLTGLNVSDCDLITDFSLRALSHSPVKNLDCSSCDRVTAAGTAEFSQRGVVRAEFCVRVGESAEMFKPWPAGTFAPPQAPPHEDPHRALKTAHANQVIHLSMLAFAFRPDARGWFFVEPARDRTVLFFESQRAEASAMYVEVSFNDVDWGFVANQFANALVNVHQRWYFYEDSRRRRVWVHARALVP